MISVASAIQRMRGRRREQGNKWTEPRLDEVFRSPIAKILDPHLYFRGRYYEPVLVAAILRSVHRHDVRSPTADEALGKMLEAHLLQSPSSGELRGELVLATIRGLLPPVLAVSDVQSAHPEIGAALRGLLGVS